MDVFATVVRLLLGPVWRLLGWLDRFYVGQAAVYSHDFVDPFVFRDGGVYHAYVIQAGGVNVQVFRSTDLVVWTLVGDAFFELLAWAALGWTWAFIVLRCTEGYCLYYTVREPALGR